VLREASDDRHGYRLRVLIVVLWHGGLRVAEALALGERDLDPGRGSLPVRNGKGGRRREIGMDAWGSEQLSPWPVARLADRAVVLRRLRPDPRAALVERQRPRRSRRLAAHAGVRRRFAPHQLRHAHAVKLARESVPLNVIQRQLGHANLGATSIYLQGIDTAEIIATVHAQARTDDVRHRRTPALTTRPQAAGALQRSRWTLTAATASTTNASATRRRPSPPFRARTSSRAGVGGAVSRRSLLTHAGGWADG
jgi:site-specific recombinase XerC